MNAVKRIKLEEVSPIGTSLSQPSHIHRKVSMHSLGRHSEKRLQIEENVTPKLLSSSPSYRVSHEETGAMVLFHRTRSNQERADSRLITYERDESLDHGNLVSCKGPKIEPGTENSPEHVDIDYTLLKSDLLGDEYPTSEAPLSIVCTPETIRTVNRGKSTPSSLYFMLFIFIATFLLSF